MTAHVSTKLNLDDFVAKERLGEPDVQPQQWCDNFDAWVGITGLSKENALRVLRARIIPDRSYVLDRILDAYVTSITTATAVGQAPQTATVTCPFGPSCRRMHVSAKEFQSLPEYQLQSAHEKTLIDNIARSNAAPGKPVPKAAATASTTTPATNDVALAALAAQVAQLTAVVSALQATSSSSSATDESVETLDLDALALTN